MSEIDRHEVKIPDTKALISSYLEQDLRLDHATLVKGLCTPDYPSRSLMRK